MTALAKRAAEIAQLDPLSPVAREIALKDAFKNALATVRGTKDIAVQARVVNDARALKAMAEAYQMSDETLRQIGEATVFCLRSFGLSLKRLYPNASGEERQKRTGVNPVTCRHAITFAKYPEADIYKALELIKTDGKDIGVERVREYLHFMDPVERARLEELRRRAKARRAEEEQRLKDDPDFETIQKIRREFSWDQWRTWKEILRLRRLLDKAGIAWLIK